MHRNRVAIVVLNYLNYKDTIECVDSVLNYDYKIEGIVVVDNGSENNSFEELKAKYKYVDTVFVIKSKKNQGFAKGNNLGIDFARKNLKAEFVLVVNNDTIFTDPEYIEKLLSRYKRGVGCLGSKIVLKNGLEQSEYTDYISVKDTLGYLINTFSSKCGSSFDFGTSNGALVKMLHGSAIMFTPDFFEFYKGFYPRTFLYGEEAILYYMCQLKSLEQVYVPETSILHKEDQSSIMSFSNDASVINAYQYRSRKYVLLWALRSYFKR